MPKRGYLRWVEPPLRILLIEDNANDVEIIRRGLNSGPEKPEIFHARDGEAGLNFLLRHGEHEEAPRPDIIISCLNLPKIDGIEILCELSNDPSLMRIPFIVLTYSEREEDMVKAYAAGASGFFTKPIDRSEFKQIVRILYTYWNTARKAPA